MTRIASSAPTRTDRCVPRGEGPRPRAYGFHELVRERIDAWMTAHPEEKGGRKEEQVWVAYGELYAAVFDALWMTGGEGSRERAVEAGRRGISYLVRARDFDGLDSFASGVVNSTRDPRLLSRMIAELEGVVEQVPAGKARWSLLDTGAMWGGSVRTGRLR